MEPRLGYDLSRVRIHAGAKAAETANGVGARAYTVGEDLVFGAGQYAPETPEGRKLLAHELTHVAQQKTDQVPSRLEVAPTDDSHEREAESNGQSVTRCEPSHGAGCVHSSVSQSSPKLRRSVLGGILGGIGGALSGVVAGALLGGPIGAIIGGVAGLIGGALAGNAATTRSRHLSTAEIAYAKEIYRDSIDYSQITITRDSLLAVGAPRTIGNTIHLKSGPPWNDFKGDTMELSDDGLKTLIHEMGHVWQFQNGGLAYIPQSIAVQIKASLGGGSRDLAYDWRAALKAGIPWEKWNPEQQAQAIEDYNIALRRTKDGTATLDDFQTISTLLPFIEKVRRREGAPHFFGTSSPASTPTTNPGITPK